MTVVSRIPGVARETFIGESGDRRDASGEIEDSCIESRSGQQVRMRSDHARIDIYIYVLTDKGLAHGAFSTSVEY